MSETDRAFDIVLWGATGFTGRLVAEYLAEHYDPSDLDWAIAGRNQSKLRSLREDLSEIDRRWNSLPIRTGDAFDAGSLEAIASQTNVVCTTVGPYATYGTKLVAACVEHGTDYCDLTGEVHWIRKMIDAYQDEARLHGSRIVHCCGFDSVPSDMGTLMVQDYAEETYGVPCEQVDFYVFKASGGFSGGTVASMANAFEEAAEDESVRRTMGDPYGLNPAGERDGPDGSIQQGPRYDEQVEAWTAPFMMATVNEKVVRRSNALLGYRWGRNFRYREAMSVGSGASGALRAAGISGGLGAFMGAMSVEPIRKLLERTVLPESGEGPSREEIEQGGFEVRLVGTGEAPDEGTFEVEATVAGDRDPGYGSTAIMLGESAVCLALDETDTPIDSGILTPASGIGMPLVERLRDAGMTFRVE